jgi:release factor glutamine methyltransferase
MSAPADAPTEAARDAADGAPDSAAVLAPGVTIAQARREIAGRFRAHGLDTPELDARLIVGHALGLDHHALTLEVARVLTRPDADRLGAVAARRLAREPVARIIGLKEFWSLPLHVTSAVLVPRPETETVVEAALAVAERGHALRIADIGVGSGAILLALLSELPNACAIGTDRDARALGVARRNAGHLGFAGRAAFVACDFGAALAGSCDLVVSNPPYVATRDIATLAPEVRDFDPRLALDGGADGLTAYRAIAADAKRLLAPGGWLVVEIGHGQAEAVSAMFAGSGLQTPEPPRRDLAGVPRVVMARRNP